MRGGFRGARGVWGARGARGARGVWGARGESGEPAEPGESREHGEPAELGSTRYIITCDVKRTRVFRECGGSSPPFPFFPPPVPLALPLPFAQISSQLSRRARNRNTHLQTPTAACEHLAQPSKSQRQSLQARSKTRRKIRSWPTSCELGSGNSFLSRWSLQGDLGSGPLELP